MSPNDKHSESEHFQTASPLCFDFQYFSLKSTLFGLACYQLYLLVLLDFSDISIAVVFLATVGFFFYTSNPFKNVKTLLYCTFDSVSISIRNDNPQDSRLSCLTKVEEGTYKMCGVASKISFLGFYIKGVKTTLHLEASEPHTLHANQQYIAMFIPRWQLSEVVFRKISRAIIWHPFYT